MKTVLQGVCLCVLEINDALTPTSINKPIYSAQTETNIANWKRGNETRAWGLKRKGETLKTQKTPELKGLKLNKSKKGLTHKKTFKLSLSYLKYLNEMVTGNPQGTGRNGGR